MQTEYLLLLARNSICVHFVHGLDHLYSPHLLLFVCHGIVLFMHVLFKKDKETLVCCNHVKFVHVLFLDFGWVKTKTKMSVMGVCVQYEYILRFFFSWKAEICCLSFTICSP